MTQMALDVIFRSLEPTVKTEDGSITPIVLASLAAADVSEAQLFSAQTFLEAVYGESTGRSSRAQTPMSPSRANTPLTVRSPQVLNSPQGWSTPRPKTPTSCLPRPRSGPGSPRKVDALMASLHRNARAALGHDLPEHTRPVTTGLYNPLPYTHTNVFESQVAKRLYVLKEPAPALNFPRRNIRERQGALPRLPDMSHLTVDMESNADFVVLVSMYEVYNDRIFDLLSPAIVPGQGTMSRGNNQKDRRRPLLFKPTEGSPDRKLVAGLRKIACGTYEEALAILDVGLTERKVTGTGMNSVSSRSHGFFSLEVKKRTYSKRTGEAHWLGNALTVVDLAGTYSRSV